MKLFTNLEQFIKRINEIDKKSRKMVKECKYSSNPFAYHKTKTYAWVEKDNDENSNGCKS